MDEMSSVEFRKRYAKLTKATVVTVSGHPIGTWTPVGQFNPDDIATAMAAMPDRYRVRPVHVAPLRSFTPAPKPGKR